MPKIPVYNSQLAPTQNVTAQRQNPNVALWGNVAKVSNEVFNIGLKFQQAEMSQDLISAGLEAKGQLNNIQQEASQDPNTQGLVDRYARRIDQVRNDVSGKLRFQGNKQTFLNSFDNMALGADVSLKNIYRKKVIANGQALSVKLDDDYVSNYLNSSSPEEKSLLTAQYMEGKKELVNSGIISPKQWQITQDNIKKKIAEGLIGQNPKNAVDYLDGELAPLKKDKALYAKLKKEAYSARGEYRKHYMENLMDSFFNPPTEEEKTTWGDIVAAQQNGDISIGQMEQAKKWFKDPNTGESVPFPSKTKAEAYNELFTSIASGKADLDQYYRLHKNITYQDFGRIATFKKEIDNLPDGQRNIVYSYINQMDKRSTDDDAKYQLFNQFMGIAKQVDYDPEKIRDTVNKSSQLYYKTKYPELNGLPDVIFDKGEPVIPLKLEEEKKDNIDIYLADKKKRLSSPADMPMDEALGKVVDNYYPIEVDKKRKAEIKKQGVGGFIKSFGKSIYYGAGKESAKAGSLMAKIAMASPLAQIMKLTNIVKEKKSGEKQGETPYEKVSSYYDNTQQQWMELSNELNKGRPSWQKYTLGGGEFLGSLPQFLMEASVLGTPMAAGLESATAGTGLAQTFWQGVVKGVGPVALGGGGIKFLEDTSEGKSVPRAFQDMAETIVTLTAFGKAFRPLKYEGANLLAKGSAHLGNFLAETSKGAAIGVASLTYDTSVGLNRLPTSQEMKEASINGAIMVGMMSFLPYLSKASRDIKEQKALNGLAGSLQKAMDNGDIKKANEAVDSVESNKEVSPVIKKEVKSFVQPEAKPEAPETPKKPVGVPSEPRKGVEAGKTIPKIEPPLKQPSGGGKVKEPLKGEATPKIETDAHNIQEIKNSIAEGEMILKAGKMTPEELQAVQRSVDRAKIRIGEEPVRGEIKPEAKPKGVSGEPLKELKKKAKQQAVEGKPSKIGKSIESKAVENKLTKRFENTAEYSPVKVKQQAERASNLINSDVNKARRIIRGEEDLPDNLKGTSLITAMEEYIKKNPDADLAYELANSPLVTKTSEAAQELRLAAEREPDSATTKLVEIKKARIDKVKNYEAKKKDVTKRLKTATKETNLSKEELSWDKFIDSIRC